MIFFLNSNLHIITNYKDRQAGKTTNPGDQQPKNCY